MKATETDGEFQLRAVPGTDPWDDRARELVGRWQTALGELAVEDPEELDGLDISLGLGELAARCPPEVLLTSPALGAAMACAARAHRGDAREVSASEVAELAGAMVRKVSGADRPGSGRYDGECLMCLEGGARYVAPSAEPLNAQLMIPSESLILALWADAERPATSAAWQGVLAGALQNLGREGAELFREPDVGRLFDSAAGRLNEEETGLLYGLLRVREMVLEYLERLGQPLLDHDILAELCDEESAMLEQYLDFPVGPYQQVRRSAVAHGALGAKLTYVFGGLPGLIVLAPGRRDEVVRGLRREFEGCSVQPVDVEPEGARAAEP